MYNNKRPCIINMTIAKGELRSAVADGCGLASKQSGVKSSARGSVALTQELTQV